MRIVDADLSVGTKRPCFWFAFSRSCSDLFLNRYFLLLQFCFACGIVLTEKEVFGAAVFVGMICVALVLCEDILATTFPFLLLCVFVTRCYDSYELFIPYIWVAIPAALSILFHFTVYRRKIQLGSTFWGLVAVSVALLLGGVGFISKEDYFRPVTLYYTIFLGIGMVVAYVLLKSQLCVKRDYDVKEKFVSLLYAMGIFVCFMVCYFLFKSIEDIKATGALPFYQPSNNLCTFLMFALPCPFFFVPRNKLHVFSPFLMLAAMVCTGSRAGIVLGAIELIVCLLTSGWWDKKRRLLYVCCCVGFIVLICPNANKILQFSAHTDLATLVSQDEPRWRLLERAGELFVQTPIFGHGLGYTGNTDIYDPVKGAMEWYHMMIPQIVAGLGIVGTVAYLFQLFLRTRAIFLPLKNGTAEQRSLVITLALSYVGVLMMSQLNPGLFCPLPYSLLAVMIFCLIDGDSVCPSFRSLCKNKETHDEQ